MADEPKQRAACCSLADDLTSLLPDAHALAAIFKAIGHPVRLQILSILSRFGGQACVCDIEHQFDLAQPTISHHLKVLRKAGLIECTRQGQWYYYTVESKAVASLQETIASLAPTDRVTA